MTPQTCAWHNSFSNSFSTDTTSHANPLVFPLSLVAVPILLPSVVIVLVEERESHLSFYETTAILQILRGWVV